MSSVESLTAVRSHLRFRTVRLTLGGVWQGLRFRCCETQRVDLETFKTTKNLKALTIEYALKLPQP